MNYLIDTNIISEVRKGAKCDPNVAAWYDALGDADIYLSVLVLGEIRKGIERARPSDLGPGPRPGEVADYGSPVLCRTYPSYRSGRCG